MKSVRKAFKSCFTILFCFITLAFAGQVFADGGTWETKAPMPTARSGATAGVINGQLYVVGGSTDWGSTNAVEAYDPATNTWTAKASIPTSPGGMKTGVIGDKLYVMGGCINSDCRIGLTNILEVYDPATNTWTSKAPMLTARFSMAVGVIDGKIYVAGGMQQCPPCTPLSTLEVYDPETDTWTTKAPMPTARNLLGDAGVIAGRLYVVGGWHTGEDWNGPFNTLEVYDPETDTWTTKAPMPTARYGTANGVINSIFYVAGGADQTGAIETLEAYNPVSNTWMNSTPIPSPRYNTTSAVLNGQLYVVGGWDGNSPLANVEAFTPGIIDTTPPVILPSVTPSPNAMGWNNSDITLSWSVTDPESGIASSTGCDTTTLTTETAGATLTCSATNAAGLSDSISVTIKIDKTPPAMTCSASPGSLWPPNHKMVNVTTSVTANDSLSGSSGFILTSVSSNEPQDGLGDGDLPNDIQGWVIGTADTTGSLRAERSGQGTGRIYTITYEGKDAADNSASCNITVKVPHDKGK